MGDINELQVGQLVWIPRTNGPCQKATITSISPDLGEVKVEWEDPEQGILGKDLPLEQVLLHPPEDDIASTPQTSEPSPTTCGDTARVICALCKLSYKNARGLRTHVAKKHPEQANELVLDTILKRKSKSEENTSSELSDIKAEVQEWANRFRTILQGSGIDKNGLDSDAAFWSS